MAALRFQSKLAAAYSIKQDVFKVEAQLPDLSEDLLNGEINCW
jgi:hypothetical protein